LGGFDAQIDAAKAYDLAALACKGLDAIINFSPEEYEQQLKEIAGFSREEVVAYVRRRSAAFSRGKSKYRGVSGHNGRWEARIGSFNGRKNVSYSSIML
jgi:AP2-like factor (euAP2 lineage)